MMSTTLCNPTFITTADVHTLERHFLAPCAEWDNGWNVFVLPPSEFDATGIARKLRLERAKAMVARLVLKLEILSDAIALAASHYNFSFTTLSAAIEAEVAKEMKAFSCKGAA